MRLLALLTLVTSAPAFADPPSIALQLGVEIAAGDPIREALGEKISSSGRLLKLPLYVNKRGDPERHSLLRQILAEVRAGVTGKTRQQASFWGAGGGSFLIDDNTRFEVLTFFLRAYARTIESSSAPFIAASLSLWASYFEILLDVPIDHSGSLQTAQAFEHADGSHFGNRMEMYIAFMMLREQQARALVSRNLSALHYSLLLYEHPHRLILEQAIGEIVRSLVIRMLKTIDAVENKSAKALVAAATVHAMEAADESDTVLIKKVLLQALREREVISPELENAVKSYPHPLVANPRREAALLWNSVLPNAAPRDSGRCEATIRVSNMHPER